MDNVAKIAVILPVYNGERYLKEAIQSVLDQTYRDFQLLLIDDGSTDSSEEIIKEFKDPRIKYIKNAQNQGIVACLNQGLEIAESEFVARMDADDVSLPTRFEKQCEFLMRHPEISVVGSHIQIFSSKDSGSSYILPLVHEELKTMLFFGSPFAHPSVMLRKCDFDTHQLRYRSEFKHAEDYDLWSRALQQLKGANYDEVLLKYRISDQQIGNNHAVVQKQIDEKIKRNLLQIFALNEQQTNTLFIFFQNGVSLHQVEMFEEICRVLQLLLKTNEDLKVVNPAIFKRQITEKIDAIVNVYANSENKLYARYKKSVFYGETKLSFKQKGKILLKQYMKMPWM